LSRNGVIKTTTSGCRIDNLEAWEQGLLADQRLPMVLFWSATLISHFCWPLWLATLGVATLLGHPKGGLETARIA